MDEDDLPTTVESVRLSGDWRDDDGDGKITLQLRVRVHACPNGRAPILRLDSGVEVHLVDETVCEAEYKDLEDLGCSRNWALWQYRAGSSVVAQRYSGGGTHKDEEEDDDDGGGGACGGSDRLEHETPRRLYEAGVRLSPSPVKERLFPPSPEGSSGSIENYGHGVNGSRAYCGDSSGTDLEDGEHQEIFGLDSAWTPEPVAYIPWNNNIVTLQDELARLGSSHQREASNTTVIHLSPENGYGHAHSHRAAYSEQHLSLSPSLSPRAYGLSVQKRGVRSRIPVKSENLWQLGTAHQSPGFSKFMADVDSPGLQTRENNCKKGNFQDPQSPWSDRASKLMIPEYSSGFTPEKHRARRSAFDNQGLGLEPDEAQALPTTPENKVIGDFGSPAFSSGRLCLDSLVLREEANVKWQIGRVFCRSEDLERNATGINSAESSNYGDGKRSHLMNLWLDDGPCESNIKLEEKREIQGECSWTTDDQGSETSQSLLQNTEDTDDARSPLISDHISLPSPTPSSKLSMPWNSVEDLVTKKAVCPSLLDIDNVEYHPSKPVKPKIETVDGILIMSFPNDAGRGIVVYEASVELRLSEPSFGISGNFDADSEDEDEEDNGDNDDDDTLLNIKWHIEYKPSRERQGLPILSMANSNGGDIAILRKPFILGGVGLDTGLFGSHGSSFAITGTFNGVNLYADILHEFVRYINLYAALVRCYEKTSWKRNLLKVGGQLYQIAQHCGLFLAAVFVAAFFLFPLVRRGNYGLEVYHEARDNDCPAHRLECQVFLRRPRLIKAENTARRSYGQNEMRYPMSPRTSTAPSSEMKNANTPPRTPDPMVGRLVSPLLPTCAPSSKVKFVAKIEVPQKREDSVVMAEVGEASNKTSLRDRIDRFLGWRGPVVTGGAN
ncbi:hypothetical protein LOZ53_003957 [Ophidiomyces ophidiicola]|nr:hypothetical protein LOZ53_003957 [Ophidiomyces ophidiicola]